MLLETVSAVVVTYNSSSEVNACLGALLRSHPDFLSDVVVVDNASQDDTCEMVLQHKGARLIRHAENKGFAAAVNTGIMNTSGEYVLILNPDVKMNSGAISELLRELSERSDYAAVGCKMVNPDGSAQASARRFPTIASFVGRVLLTNSVARRLRISSEIGEWSNIADKDHGIVEVDWILGGCMLIKRSAYKAIGPLDENYFLYYEDIDWCFRAGLRHWKIGYSTNTQVIHAHRRSSSQVSVTNRLMWVHLSSAFRFFRKFAGQRGLNTVF